MPCSDSSSSIAIKLDQQGHLANFDFAKITCGQRIEHATGYSDYCRGKSLEEILQIGFSQVVSDLKISDEEKVFVLYLEWDCLRSAISQYLGREDENIDSSRSMISSVEYSEDGVEITQVVLPPKELPKILPCSLAAK